MLNLFLEGLLKYLLHIWCRRGLLLLMMHMSLLSGVLAILMIAVGAQKRCLWARTPARFYLIGFLAHCCCLKRFTASEDTERGVNERGDTRKQLRMWGNKCWAFFVVVCVCAGRGLFTVRNTDFTSLRGGGGSKWAAIGNDGACNTLIYVCMYACICMRPVSLTLECSTNRVVGPKH